MKLVLIPLMLVCFVGIVSAIDITACNQNIGDGSYDLTGDLVCPGGGFEDFALYMGNEVINEIDCHGYWINMSNTTTMLFNIVDSQTIFRNCKFSWTAGTGGGTAIRIDGVGYGDFTFRIENSVFNCDLTASGSGSCLTYYYISYYDSYITNSTFNFFGGSDDIGVYFAGDPSVPYLHYLHMTDNNLTFVGLTSFYTSGPDERYLSASPSGNYYYSTYDPIYDSSDPDDCQDTNYDGICNNPFSTGDTLFNDNYPLAYPAPYDSCVPNWSCNSFDICNSSNIIPCLSVEDINACDESFTGDLADYDDICTFTIPSSSPPGASGGSFQSYTAQREETVIAPSPSGWDNLSDQQQKLVVIGGMIGIGWILIRKGVIKI